VTAPIPANLLAGPPPVAAASVADVELATAVPALLARDGAQAWLVVRLFTEPLGIVVVDVPPAGRTRAEVLARVVDALGPAISARLATVGRSLADLGTDGVAPASPPPFPASRVDVLRRAPACTVVVCTRDRPDGLRTTLASLVHQEHPRFDVLVVDSASGDDRTRLVVEELADALDIRYLRHPVPGLSRARNRALAQVSAPVVAWLDDDATADRFWLAELARGFAAAPGAVAVSGAVVPRTLERQAQLWFEQFGGHSKGRGFTPDVFSSDTHARQSPLYPLPPFGVGTNMAFRTDALLAIGGFDDALGAGTATKGGEDTLALTEVMLDGGTVVYQPSALVRHVHRPTVAALRAQLDGYGTGLTAFYLALLRRRPATLLPLLRLLPRAVRDLRSADSVRTASLGDDFPAELLASNLRAMLRGPGAYLRQRRADRRALR
jgi:cellulose synthase/poly-beta-1,6-N-acetylglucosamine synthase-like glycosyltransferase